jgi:lipopolysaccharide export system protein LptA
VQAKILRTPTQNDLRELIAEGSVHVVQEGATPQDKGVDIKGEIVTLDHHVSGNVLVVIGNERGPAQLQLGELFLLGPKVTINQQKNEAKIEGIGAMHMPSNTTFEGGKPAKPGTRITVHWTRDMLFDGQGADFHGGVVAYQDSSSLKCETLQVTFDKVVSLKEGQKKGEQSPRVEKLVAHGKVYIQDRIQDEKGKLIRYQRLTGHQVEFDHQTGPGNVTGPGRFYLLQPGSVTPLAGGKEPGPPALVPPGSKAAPMDRKNEPPKETTLTRVAFEDHMYSNNKSAIRRSTFWGRVKVFHVPANDPDIELDELKLPKGGIYLESDLLNVYSKPEANGKSHQTLIAEKRVAFRTQEFYGRANVVKYDSATELVVFEGSSDNPATLFQVVQQGAQPQTIRGKTIIYNRVTGTFRLDGGTEIKWSNR